jgi:hypothetical protein
MIKIMDFPRVLAWVAIDFTQKIIIFALKQ